VGPRQAALDTASILTWQGLFGSRKPRTTVCILIKSYLASVFPQRFEVWNLAGKIPFFCFLEHPAQSSKCTVAFAVAHTIDNGSEL